MNIKQLQYFVAVVENGTITAAAKKLGISQPPLSAQMKLLEEELGVTLMERGARQVRLTDAGRILYRRAVSIVELTDTTLKELDDFRSGISGVLRLGTVSSCGTGLLKSKMVAFRDRFPAVRFEIYEGNTLSLAEQVKNGLIDLAVVRAPFRSEEFSCVFLEEEPMVAVGDERYFAKLPWDSAALSDLEGLPLICYRRWESLIRATFEEEGIVPNIYCLNDDARTSLMWAAAGLGVAVVPRSICSAITRKGMLYKKIREKGMYTRMAAIRKKGGYCSPLMQEFLTIFAQQE
ncbi:MAG: LysR family transcriptional regulator [Oscillospiraceae bacterium]|nr:LysR family transcriptional regulator [Oscillospiraceae bacterium]